MSAKLFVLMMFLAGIASTWLTSRFGWKFWFRAPDLSLVIYFVLAAVTARMTVKIPYSSVHFSVDTPFVFVIMILYGPFWALMADAVAKLILSVANITRAALFKIPFNISSGVLAIFGAGIVFQQLYDGGGHTSSHYILPIVGMTLGYYFINTMTVSMAICISEKQNLLIFWIKNFLPTSVGFLASGSIATLLFILDATGSYLGFIVTIPLVGLIYYSQQVYLLKETDAKNHISELENVHISTIKSLSLALDAKDEYTHGHVYRVSAYAVGLAKFLGITDKNLLQGIAFAGLVHDIGKIAIPDNILNKPGKYTEAEMNRMKIHPEISAEILKNIPLPFPVAKIVRHHHEKWDGRGYPDGLPGLSIPFESRILAVADVYDAIRSDRPYRPKMELERAVKIMESEKGKTLDPDMVDVFLANLDKLEQCVQSQDAEMPDNAIQDIVKASYLAYGNADSESVQAGPTDKETRKLAMFNGLSNLFSNNSSLMEKLNGLATTITGIIPHNALVVYLPDESGKELRPICVSAKDSEGLEKNLLQVGFGVTGWAFANKLPMVSVPPDTEFPTANFRKIPYKSALAVPLINMGESLGAVTLYSENSDAFNGEDQDLIVQISPIVGPLIKNLMDRAAEKSAGERRKVLQLKHASGDN